MKIFWDTNLFIYLWEESELAREIEELRRFIREGGHTVATSALTLGEVLVLPIRLGREDLAAQYRRAFGKLEVLAFDAEAAGRFARLRATCPALRAPDAIQLACAASAGCDWFLTNDDRLSKMNVEGIQSIRSLAAWRG